MGILGGAAKCGWSIIAVDNWSVAIMAMMIQELLDLDLGFLAALHS